MFVNVLSPTSRLGPLLPLCLCINSFCGCEITPSSGKPVFSVFLFNFGFTTPVCIWSSYDTRGVGPRETHNTVR